jgi:1,2-diacylglycerol 3-alpha-glucosyltransferase
LRILIASQIYAPAANGQAVFTTQLAEGLAGAGHDVAVVLPSERWRSYRERRNGVELHALAAVPVGFKLGDAYLTPLPVTGLRRLFDEFQPEVVHLQDHYPLCRWIAGMAARRGLPLIGTNHFIPQNIVHYVLPFRPGRGLVNKILWWTMTSLYRHMDVVTTPTETAAGILRETGLQAPVQAISCGVNLHHYAPIAGLDPQAVRREFGLNPESTLLLYVGRIDEEKDLQVIVRALPRIDDDVQFVIVGEGRYESAIHRLVEQLDLGARVVFTGFLPESDLPRVLQTADVFVMPSPAELQSIATLEAMATGKPVLAARSRALPELIDDGVNGVLFAPGDVEDAVRQIRSLLGKRDRWRAMGQAGRRKVVPHHIESTIESYEHLYARLMSERRQPIPPVPAKSETTLRP